MVLNDLSRMLTRIKQCAKKQNIFKKEGGERKIGNRFTGLFCNLILRPV